MSSNIAGKSVEHQHLMSIYYEKIRNNIEVNEDFLQPCLIIHYDYLFFMVHGCGFPTAKHCSNHDWVCYVRLASNGYWVLVSSQKIIHNDIKWVRQCFGTWEFIAIMRLYNGNTHTYIYIFFIYILYYLVVAGTMENYDFPFNWEIQKIPTDELTHIFKRGRLKPPTR